MTGIELEETHTIRPTIAVTGPHISGSHRDVAGEDFQPDQYAEAVDGFSRLPTGAGQNYERLAKFLSQKPTKSSSKSKYSPASIDAAFITLYRLGQVEEAVQNGNVTGEASTSQRTKAHNVGPDKSVEYFCAPHEFAEVSPPRDKDKQSQIIFLRGFPSPEWLKLIGSKYRVDPEYFCRHLDFKPTEDRSSNFSTPSLPSSSWHLIRLPIMTNGTRDSAKSQVKQEDINRLRKEGDDALEAHHHNLMAREFELQLGDSIIRQYHTFDETHFSMEQRISICMQDKGDNFVVFIWCDSANAFENHTPGPWSNATAKPRARGDKYRVTNFLPIIRYKPMVALKSHLMAPTITSSKRSPRNPSQPASLLHLDYGRSLHTSVMISDALYALNEIFTFAAPAEMQFLNLVDAKMDKFTRPGLKELDSLPNLKYIKGLLFRHIQYMEEVKDCLHNSDHRKWPKASGVDRARAVAAAAGVRQDFEHLHHRAQMLHTRCTESIAVLMNSIAIAESQEAIAQTKRLGKLTFLAFIFVPLSFTTSFFGMNLRELAPEQGLPLWTWFTLSIPVTALTVSLFFFDLSRVRKILKL